MRKKIALPNKDLVFTFKYVNLTVLVNEDFFDEEEYEKIKTTAKQVSKCICIDKSYVNFKDSKHEKVFLTNVGWNELCELVHTTKFGKRCSNMQYHQMMNAYKAMIVGYMYQLFEDIGYDIEGIYFEVPDDKFMIEYAVDTVHAWKHYPGKW